MKLKGKEPEKKKKKELKPDVNPTTDDNDEKDLNDKLNNIIEGLRLLYKRQGKIIGLISQGAKE